MCHTHHMETKPILIDAYCGAGGATRGYQQAGFYVIGVDISPQPHYIGDEFYQGDACEFITQHHHHAQAVAGSPPCQAKTKAQKIMKNDHPKLIAPTRRVFHMTGLPYVIENVLPLDRATDDDPLIDPFQLCGCMFPGLNVYRTREFESNVIIPRPSHQPHLQAQTKMGRPLRAGERMHVVGNFSGVPQAREAMGIPWMVRDELSEAIPPAYTRYIGTHLREALT